MYFSWRSRPKRRTVSASSDLNISRRPARMTFHWGGEFLAMRHPEPRVPQQFVVFLHAGDVLGGDALAQPLALRVTKLRRGDPVGEGQPPAGFEHMANGREQGRLFGNVQKRLLAHRRIEAPVGAVPGRMRRPR